MTRADRKRIETIARACGWEYEITSAMFIDATKAGIDFPFSPFTSEAHWFRAFNAMECRCLTVQRMWFLTVPEMWAVKVNSDYYAEHPDRQTAMGEALYQAALKKLGEATP